MTARGEGFGKELGLGSKRLCAKYGRPELSMTVKGQEFPAYDSRGIQGMGLAYATSNRGACHLRGYTVASEVLGIPVKTDPHVTEGKAGLVKAFQDATGVFDSSGLCVFTTFAWTLADIQPQLQAACEGDWSMEKLALVGERIWNLERQFNNAAGFTAKDDNLPPRLTTEPAKTGPAKGLVNGLDKMLPEYYEVRGWTQGRRADEGNADAARPSGLIRDGMAVGDACRSPARDSQARVRVALKLYASLSDYLPVDRARRTASNSTCPPVRRSPTSSSSSICRRRCATSCS